VSSTLSGGYRVFRWLKRAVPYGGMALFLVSLLPPAPGLTVASQRTLGIFFLAVAFWLAGRPFPPAITGLMVMGLVPLTGVLGVSETFALFGNRAVFFILGAFILAAGLLHSGLARRLSTHLLNAFRGSAFALVAGVFLVTDLMSWFIPEHVVAALTFPVLFKLLHRLQVPREHREFEALLFLSMAWGSVIGGIATPLGGARAPLAIGILQEEFGIRIQFLDWSLAALPVTLLLTLFGLLYLYLLTRRFHALDARIREVQPEDASGPLSTPEKRVILVFGLALVGWILLDRWVDFSVTAILAALLLFLFQVVTWKEVEGYVNWGVILMYGGAIVLGKTMVESGAALVIARWLLFPFAHHPWGAFLVLTVLALLLTELISNVATVALLLPLAYSLVQPLGLDPVFLTFVVTLPAGLPFMLPMGTPPNALAFSSGKYSVGYALRRGVVFHLAALATLALVAFGLWPWMGIG